MWAEPMNSGCGNSVVIGARTLARQSARNCIFVKRSFVTKQHLFLPAVLLRRAPHWCKHWRWARCSYMESVSLPTSPPSSLRSTPEGPWPLVSPTLAQGSCGAGAETPSFPSGASSSPRSGSRRPGEYAPSQPQSFVSTVAMCVELHTQL